MYNSIVSLSLDGLDYMDSCEINKYAIHACITLPHICSSVYGPLLKQTWNNNTQFQSQTSAATKSIEAVEKEKIKRNNSGWVKVDQHYIYYIKALPRDDMLSPMAFN